MVVRCCMRLTCVVHVCALVCAWFVAACSGCVGCVGVVVVVVVVCICTWLCRLAYSRVVVCGCVWWCCVS